MVIGCFFSGFHVSQHGDLGTLNKNTVLVKHHELFSGAPNAEEIHSKIITNQRGARVIVKQISPWRKDRFSIFWHYLVGELLKSDTKLVLHPSISNKVSQHQPERNILIELMRKYSTQLTNHKFC